MQTIKLNTNFKKCEMKYQSIFTLMFLDFFPCQIISNMISIKCNFSINLKTRSAEKHFCIFLLMIT